MNEEGYFETLKDLKDYLNNLPSEYDDVKVVTIDRYSKSANLSCHIIKKKPSYENPTEQNLNRIVFTEHGIVMNL